MRGTADRELGHRGALQEGPALFQPGHPLTATIADLTEQVTTAMLLVGQVAVAAVHRRRASRPVEDAAAR